MSALGTPLLLGEEATGYQISRSVRLRSSASGYLTRTPASAGTRTKWTKSFWVKRGTVSVGQDLYCVGSSGVFEEGAAFLSGNALQIWSYASGAWQYQLVTTQLFRDPSAWYHIVIAVDTTQATASNRIKLYVNGSQVTAFTTSTYPSLNYSTYINTTNAHNIGRYFTGVDYFDGYLTEVNFIDGQALTPSSFGETDVLTGVWKPKRYAGTYGTNGFYLNFSDNSAATAAAIGKDWSGNGNNWTPNNISVTSGVTYDSMLDTPTPYADGGNGRGNYCVINPLTGASTAAVANGNLGVGMNGSEGRKGTIAVTSGKWYWECSFTVGVIDASIVGIANPQDPNIFVTSATGYGYYSNANKVNNNTAVAYGAAWGVSDTIGVALDLDAGTLTFYKNGTSQGTAYTGLSGLFCPAFATNASGSTNFRPNFGQRPFAYTPPTGFKALNTQNLPDATIKKGNAYFDVTLWTGDGSTSRTITNSGFQPDFIWTKRRSSGTANSNHWLFDSVRGAGSNSLLTLESNSTSAEFDTKGGSGNATAITASGFTITGGTSNNNNLNESGSTFAAWQWKAGGTAVSNTSGSITSQVSANVAAGFSIVTWTGTGAANATVGHGLGVAPKLYIMKKRNGTGALPVAYTIVDGSLDFMYLNTTSAAGNASQPAPTSSVINVQSASGDNELNAQLVAYLFAEVAGFSAFGKYTGNGSTDGPFVYCGFRPRFVMVKNATTAATVWCVWDSARDTYNQITDGLQAQSSSAEATGFDVDFLSNGFKIKDIEASLNGSGATIIFAAFAENPFKNSLAR